MYAAYVVGDLGNLQCRHGFTNGCETGQYPQGKFPFLFNG